MSEESNAAPAGGEELTVVRRGSDAAPVVVAVGPTLDEMLAATAELDATVAYLSTVRPFDAAGLRALARGTDVVLVEPYLAGTSAGEIAAALTDRPHRLLALGVPNAEFRHYGAGAEHRAAHGLDAAGIGQAIRAFAGELAVAA
jgi:transketolase